ncbi:uncharacterized protein A4U43_C07F26530 [Asparagus officinalis]|uniref:Uncharacterized protein n=1 Tax=Asparagus officinalis TaxID=4686 RepID=A0A5P1EF55_ASPOF|nr:uncharacterized protein A4U43_C07F26530 [Asparagus officinalis]
MGPQMVAEMMKTKVIRIDESSPRGSAEAPPGEGVEAIIRDSEAGSSDGHGESFRHGKEPVDESKPSSMLKYPFIHRVDEIGDEKWQKMYEYLIWTYAGGRRRMEHIRTTYLKLLGEVDSLRTSRRVDSRWATESRAPEAIEVEKLKQELGEDPKEGRGTRRGSPGEGLC